MNEAELRARIAVLEARQRDEKAPIWSDAARATTLELSMRQEELHALLYPDVETPLDTEGAVARVQKRRELDSAYDDLQQRLARVPDRSPEARRIGDDLLAVRAGLDALDQEGA
jgi:hypothetical protein